MKKIMIILATLVILFGCSEMEKDIYQGEFIEVGVVGSQSLPDIQNVQYKNVELSDVKGKKEEFDVLLISPEAFLDADKDKYIVSPNYKKISAVHGTHHE